MVKVTSAKGVSKRKDVTLSDKKQAEVKYGSVTFADAKNKKYPIDTPGHIRAAWSYIHWPKNRAKYDASEVVAIEQAILRAWKTVIGKDSMPTTKSNILAAIITEIIKHKTNPRHDERDHAGGQGHRFRDDSDDSEESWRGGFGSRAQSSQPATLSRSPSSGTSGLRARLAATGRL